MTYRPFVLLAEMTYACPLHCPYCSNPTNYPEGLALSTQEWTRVFHEAAALGVIHLGLSGGEPLLRPDLATLVKEAKLAGLYSNLITSGVGLSPSKVVELKIAGLDSIQISFQSDTVELADEIAGATVHELKLSAASAIVQAGLPLSINIVLHRANIERLPQLIELARGLGAQRLELANVQYYGWAVPNKKQLLPTREQVTAAQTFALEAKHRLAGKMEVLYVLPDFYQDRPKPCMQGWGRQYLTVNPIGQVLPCPNAFSIPDLPLENIRKRSLAEIWNDSESFNRFRGFEWMPEPCRSCPEREIDFGGCRCQAALLSGNAASTDPVCSLAPNHGLIGLRLAEKPPTSDWIPRKNPQKSPLTVPG